MSELQSSPILELETAVERILALIPPPAHEKIVLGASHRRVLTERILSPLDLPGFDNSAMDGYAVRAADLHGVSAESPRALELRGRVAAGETFDGEVAPGACVRVFTGSPLPRGADAVVMQEDTRPDAARPGAILFLDSVKPWENVRFRGEDLKCGDVIGEPGDVLSAGRINLLAAAGLEQVSVGTRPVAGLLASGSELLEAGQPPAPGKIYESNRLGLAALAAQAGAVPKIFPLVRDMPDDTQAALQTAFQQCDVVITSGGVSVGEMDFIKSAFAKIGGELQFWRVAIRPGRPFVFGRIGNKFLFGLPGNPVSAFVTFLLLVRPALARWQGARDVTFPAHPGVLAEPLSNPGDRRHFTRVVVDAAGNVHTAGAQASHLLGSLAAANGLVDVPPRTTLPSGGKVSVLRWE